MRAVFFMIPLLSLSACASGWSTPSFIPSGYTYHNADHVYKNQPGPEAPSLGYEYAQLSNAETMMAWDVVAEDLVAQMEADLSLEPQPLFLDFIRGQNAFRASFDHAMRKALMKRGYRLKNESSGALGLRYEAVHPRDLKGGDENIKIKDFDDYHFTLSIIEGGKLTAQTEAIYTIPSFGYQGYDDKEGESSPRTRTAGLK